MKRNKTLTCVLSLGLLVTLFGCNQQKQPDPEPEPEPVVLSDEQLGLLDDYVFYSTDGNLTVDANGAKLTKADGSVVELVNDSVNSETGFLTEITYKDSNNKKYKLTYESIDYTVGGEDDPTHEEFENPVLTVEGTDSKTVFYPSAASFSGIYTGYGDTNYYNFGYIFTDEFDSNGGYFKGAICNSQYGYSENSFFGRTSFDADGKIIYSYYVPSSLEAPWWNLFPSDLENGKIGLYYSTLTTPEDGSEPYYSDFLISAPQFFNYTFFDEANADAGIYSDGLAFSSPSDDDSTVYIGWDDEPTAFTEGHDANGCYAKLADGRIIRSTMYGITVENEGKVVEMPYFDTSALYNIFECEFKHGDTTISYATNWDTYDPEFLVNGEVCESSFVIYNHKVAIKGVDGDNVYYLLPNDGSSSVIVYENGVKAVYINEDENIYKFIGSYFDEDGNIVTIGDDLKVTVGETEYQGKLDYSDDYGVYFSFNGLIFTDLSTDNGLYCSFNENDDEDSHIYVTKDLVESLYDTYTSGSDVFTLSATGVSGANESCTGLKFTMLSLTTDYFAAVTFVYRGSTYYIVLSPDQNLMLYKGDTTGGYFVASYEPQSLFDKAVGTYLYEGEYGLEHITLTESGKFTLSIMNETKDGIVDSTPDYLLTCDDDGNFTVYFEYTFIDEDGEEQETHVPAILIDDTHFSIGGVIYTRDFNYYLNGAYLSDDGKNVIFFHDKNVYINGTSYTISSYSLNSDNTYSIVLSDDSTITYDPNDKLILSGETIYSYHDFGSAFNGTYENVSSQNFDIKINGSTIQLRSHSADEAEDAEYTITISDYYLTIDENGNYVIKFTYAAINYTFTLTKDGVEANGVFSLPIPPVPSF